MKFIFLILTSIVIISGSSIAAYSSPTIAFGYLSNITQNKEYAYLETVFPISFATALEKEFEVKIIKPLSLDRLLKEKKKTLKLKYTEQELPTLVKEIKSDFFVYGSFIPLKNNKIKITISLYIKSSKKIFKFENIGKMETEIFKLVDRISKSLFTFLSDGTYLKKGKIKKNSKIALLTNLNGKELNKFYYYLFNKNYKSLIPLNGNSLKSTVENKLFKRLSNIRSSRNSFDTIKKIKEIDYDSKKIKNKKYLKKVKIIKSLHNKYDKKFILTRSKFLKRLRDSYNNKLEYLLIIGFKKIEDDSSNSVWLRAIDMKNNNLIWIEKKIKGDSLEAIANSIVSKLEK